MSESIATMGEIDIPFLTSEETRHGKTIYRVRRFGKRIQIYGEPGTDEFQAAYQAALATLQGEPPEKRKRVASGTLEWLGRQYMASIEFKALDERSRATRKGVLDSCFAAPYAPGSARRMGDCPLSAFGPAHVQTLRDQKADKPGAANNRRKYLSSMFRWAISQQTLPVRIATNPCRDVTRLDYETDGFHTWSDDDVARFEAHHEPGSRARLALALLLYTGARRGDVVTFGPQHIRQVRRIDPATQHPFVERVLTFTPRKTRRKKKVKQVTLPVLPLLQAAIDATPPTDLAFLMTQYGRPFTANGFGGWFRDRCDEAGLPHCTAHGLRKAGATRLASQGATAFQLMAVFGWADPKEAMTYIQAADQARLAAQIMDGLSNPVGHFASNHRTTR